MENSVTADYNLHGLECLLTLKQKEDSINLQLFEKNTGQIWKGEFTSKYIEDITQKTGNFKKFPIFVKMFISAMRNETPAVHVDILTAQDLEELKSKKTGAASNKPITTSNKRYLILSSTSEFDKVHYPLPISLEENPDTETLKQAIARMSQEIENFRCKTGSVMGQPDNISEVAKTSFYSEAPIPGANSTSRTVEEIRGENERLKRKLALLEKGGSQTIDESVLSKLEKYKDIDKVLKDSENEAKTLRNRLNETQQMLNETKSELFKTMGELGHFEKLQGMPDPETIKGEIERLKKEMEEERKINEQEITKQNEILLTNQKELEKARENDKAIKNRIKDLEHELEAALKKANYSMYGSRGSSRPNSNSSRKSNYSYKYSPAPSRSNSNNKRANSVPQKKQTPTRPAPMRNNYTKPTPPPRTNKFQNRYSPAGGRSNSGNRGPSPVNKAAPRTNSGNYGYNKHQSPASNRRSPAPYGKPSPLRNTSNQRQNNYAAPKSQPKKDTGVFNRLYGAQNNKPDLSKKCNPSVHENKGENQKIQNLNKEIKEVKTNDIDDRLKKLQNIIKAAKA